MKPVERGRSPPTHYSKGEEVRQMIETVVLIAGAVTAIARTVKAIAEAIKTIAPAIKSTVAPRRGKHAKDTASHSSE